MGPHGGWGGIGGCGRCENRGARQHGIGVSPGNHVPSQASQPSSPVTLQADNLGSNEKPVPPPSTAPTSGAWSQWQPCPIHCDVTQAHDITQRGQGGDTGSWRIDGVLTGPRGSERAPSTKCGAANPPPKTLSCRTHRPGFASCLHSWVVLHRVSTFAGTPQ